MLTKGGTDTVAVPGEYRNKFRSNVFFGELGVRLLLDFPPRGVVSDGTIHSADAVAAGSNLILPAVYNFATGLEC